MQKGTKGRGHVHRRTDPKQATTNCMFFQMNTFNDHTQLLYMICFFHHFIIFTSFQLFVNSVFVQRCPFLHHRVFLLQPLNFFDQEPFILRHGSWDLGFQRLFQSSFKTSYNQSLFQAWFNTSFKSWKRRRTCYVHTLNRVSLSISGAGGKVHGGSSFLVQPILVLATQWLIPPTERTCISSWNRSETSGRDCFQSDSVTAHGVGNRNTATASTS